MARPARSRTPDKSPDPVAEVRAIYAELEGRAPHRDCTLRTGCCHFRITGRIPYLTRGEAEVAARGVRASGRRALPEHPDGACPLLHASSGRCMIYADRPFGCRTHFCDPAGGPFARRDVIDLIRRLEAIDARMGGDGGRALPGAVAEALRRL